MAWKANFCTGIAAIDSQHRQIFEHLLAIENAVAKKDPWHIVRSLLAQLSEYLHIHLAVEDALLDVLRYPRLQAHRATHDTLKAALTGLEICLRNSLSAQCLVEFFERWFIHHVLTEDMRFAPYVRDCMPFRELGAAAADSPDAGGPALHALAS